MSEICNTSCSEIHRGRYLTQGRHAIYLGFQLSAAKYAEHCQCDGNVKENHHSLSEIKHVQSQVMNYPIQREGKKVGIINNKVTNYNGQQQSS